MHAFERRLVLRRPFRLAADIGVMLLALLMAVWPVVAAFLLVRLVAQLF